MGTHRGAWGPASRELVGANHAVWTPAGSGGAVGRGLFASGKCSFRLGGSSPRTAHPGSLARLAVAELG